MAHGQLFTVPPGDLRASQVAQWVRTCLEYRRCQRYRFDSWVRKIPWRRAWQPTPVFLPGESHEQRSLVGYRPWSCRVGRDWSAWAQHGTAGDLQMWLIPHSQHPKEGKQRDSWDKHLFNQSPFLLGGNVLLQWTTKGEFKTKWRCWNSEPDGTESTWRPKDFWTVPCR